MVVGPFGVLLVRDVIPDGRQPADVDAWRCISDSTELGQRLGILEVRGLVVNGEPVSGHPELLTCPRSEVVGTIEALPAVWDRSTTVDTAQWVNVTCPPRREESR